MFLSCRRCVLITTCNCGTGLWSLLVGIRRPFGALAMSRTKSASSTFVLLVCGMCLATLIETPVRCTLQDQKHVALNLPNAQWLTIATNSASNVNRPALCCSSKVSLSTVFRILATVVASVFPGLKDTSILQRPESIPRPWSYTPNITTVSDTSNRHQHDCVTICRTSLNCSEAVPSCQRPRQPLRSLTFPETANVKCRSPLD